MKDNPRAVREATRYSLGVIFLLGVLFAAPAFAAGNLPDAGMPPFPALTGPVMDQAKLLPPDVNAALAQKLAQYAQDTGTQLVVVTLPTLNNYPIENYGYELGRHWGIGQKGNNNGALLIVDAGEKQVRIEVGYGLEGTLTDAQSFNIIHNIIVPRFKQGNFAGGITAGVDAILTVLGNQQQALAQQKARNRSGTGFLMILIILFALWPLIAAIFSKGRGGRGGPGSGSHMGWLGWLALGMLSGGIGRGGGGLGGGGFGGFSGGGGSFGGGGASGGW